MQLKFVEERVPSSAVQLRITKGDQEKGWKLGRHWTGGSWAGHHRGSTPGRIAGYQGELAVARHFGGERRGGEGQPDVLLPNGLAVEVRTRIGMKRDMLILPGDQPARPFLLVVGDWAPGGPEYNGPRGLWWIGWCYGSEGCNLGRWAEELPSPTWLIEQGKLRAPATFAQVFGPGVYEKAPASGETRA